MPVVAGLGQFNLVAMSETYYARGYSQLIFHPEVHFHCPKLVLCSFLQSFKLDNLYWLFKLIAISWKDCWDLGTTTSSTLELLTQPKLILTQNNSKNLRFFLQTTKSEYCLTVEKNNAGYIPKSKQTIWQCTLADLYTTTLVDLCRTTVCR